MTQKETVLLFLESELSSITQKAKNKALCVLNGGNMPKKKRVVEIENSPEYDGLVKHYLEELDQLGIQNLLSIAERNWTEESLRVITTSIAYRCFIDREEKKKKEAKEKAKREQKQKEEIAMIDDFIESDEFERICCDAQESVVNNLKEEIRDYFTNVSGLIYPQRDYYFAYRGRYDRYNTTDKEADSLEEFFEHILNEDDGLLDETVMEDICSYNPYDYPVTSKAMEEVESALTVTSNESEWYISDSVVDAANEYDMAVLENVRSCFDKNTILSLLKKNESTSQILQQFALEEKEKEMAEMSILDHIPEKYADLYPATRKMHRNFVLHVGPTNSGKTHDAIKALEASGNGVYLAPLRLLAYEQFEKMNQDGFHCSLLTGEERIDVPESAFTASTIEMANYGTTYSAAVIDEAQMICDRARGGSWTSAILGIRAKEIHICMSEDAESLVIRLINECKDNYTVVRHERKTPLICEQKPFNYPQDVESGDALIVFSRRNVHAVAAELQKMDYACSVIYGALPYTVRHEQAELFASGKNNIVVATDAIGMGMNLPIKRVVFLEQKKYDGLENRPLLPCEYKQIAGRAGRLGMYDEGLVTSSGGKNTLRKALEAKEDQLKYAVIAFPEVLIGINSKLSTIIERWIAMDAQQGYVKAVAEREAMLCRQMEKYTNDKRFIYRFITIPFDEKNVELIDIWTSMYKCELDEKEYAVADVLARIDADTNDLQVLEENYRVCDLLYVYCDRFAHPEHVDAIQKLKIRLSKKIADELSKKKLKERKCKYCGETLPWNYPYGMCQQCHNKMYPPRRKPWDDDTWDDEEDWY